MLRTTSTHASRSKLTRALMHIPFTQFLIPVDGLKLELSILDPLLHRNKPGRKKNTRKRGIDEPMGDPLRRQSGTVHCTNCHQAGHNKKTCTNDYVERPKHGSGVGGKGGRPRKHPLPTTHEGGGGIYQDMGSTCDTQQDYSNVCANQEMGFSQVGSSGVTAPVVVSHTPRVQESSIGSFDLPTPIQGPTRQVAGARRVGGGYSLNPVAKNLGLNKPRKNKSKIGLQTQVIGTIQSSSLTTQGGSCVSHANQTDIRPYLTYIPNTPSQGYTTGLTDYYNSSSHFPFHMSLLGQQRFAQNECVTIGDTQRKISKLAAAMGAKNVNCGGTQIRPKINMPTTTGTGNESFTGGTDFRSRMLGKENMGGMKIGAFGYRGYGPNRVQEHVRDVATTTPIISRPTLQSKLTPMEHGWTKEPINQESINQQDPTYITHDTCT